MTIKTVTTTPMFPAENTPVLSAESGDLSPNEASTEIIDFFETNSATEKASSVQKDTSSIRLKKSNYKVKNRQARRRIEEKHKRKASKALSNRVSGSSKSPTKEKQSSIFVSGISGTVKETLKRKTGATNEVDAQADIKAQDLKSNLDRAKQIQQLKKTLGGQSSFTTEVTIKDEAGKDIFHLHSELNDILNTLNQKRIVLVEIRDNLVHQFNCLFDTNTKYRVTLLEKLSSPTGTERFSQQDLITHLCVEEIFLQQHSTSAQRLSQLLNKELPPIEIQAKRFISMVVIELIYGKLNDKSKVNLKTQCRLKHSDEIIQTNKNKVIPFLVIIMATECNGSDIEQQYKDTFCKDSYGAEIFVSKFFNAVKCFEQSEAVCTLTNPINYWSARAIMTSNNQDLENNLFAICQLKKIIEPITDLDSLQKNRLLELALTKYMMKHEETLKKICVDFNQILISHNFDGLKVEAAIIIEIAINESIIDFILKIITTETKIDENKNLLVLKYTEVCRYYEEFQASLKDTYHQKLSEVAERVGQELVAREEADKLQLEATTKQTSKHKKELHDKSEPALTEVMPVEITESEEDIEWFPALEEQEEDIEWFSAVEEQKEDEVKLCCQLLYKCSSENRIDVAQETLVRIEETFLNIPLSDEKNTQLVIAILDCLLLKTKQAFFRLLEAYKVLLSYQQKILTDFSNSKGAENRFRTTILNLPNQIFALKSYLNLLSEKKQTFEPYLSMPIQNPDLQASHEMLKSELCKIISLIADVPDIPFTADQIYKQRGVKIREKFAKITTVSPKLQMKRRDEMRASIISLRQYQIEFHGIIKRLKYVSEDLQQRLSSDDEWPVLKK